MDGTPNLLSSLVLFLWVPIALVVMRKWPAPKATAGLLLAAVLLLPEVIAFKLPGIPEFRKTEISILWIVIGGFLFHRSRFRNLGLTRGLKFVIVLFLVGSVITIFQNGDDFSVGVAYFPAHQPYDAVHALTANLLTLIFPFLLGVAMFRNAKELLVLFKMTVAAALLYSLLQLIEIRLSPQLHTWVYGFMQHEFAQTVRSGGFRPMVFMSHGLAVALFTTTALFCAAALYKLQVRVFRIGASWIVGYLWILLGISKSLAAFLYSLVAVPLILFSSPKFQVRVAMLLALLVLSYPLARAVGLVPVKEIGTFVTEQFGKQRAQSLQFRFGNEEQLLERAQERLFFGWGAFGRACIFDEYSGKELSVRDGEWIIMMGDLGLVGFLGKFLVLLIPIFLVWRRFDLVNRPSERILLAALSLVVAFGVVDLLPNGNYNHLVVVYAGALFGGLVGILQETALRRQRKATVQAT